MNTTKKQFAIFTYTNWVADDFREGLKTNPNYEITHSLGLDIPRNIYEADKEHNALYWMPSFFAARLQQNGLAQQLTSPGRDFMSNLPYNLTKREIKTETITSFINRNLQKVDDVFPLFVKPAEAKLDYFPAATYTLTQLQQLILKHPLDTNFWIQYTTIKKPNYEHRFYVLNGEVVTGSAYLVNDGTYYENMDNPEYQSRLNEATDYVKNVLPEILHQPEGYTLDVAWDEKDKEWFILEANPAWCSGVYGCDIEAATETINKSCNPTNTDWLWKPDTLLINKAKIQPALKVFS